jgi:hypothetical protein
MPAGYEHIKAALIKAGKPEDKATEEAAKIWNKHAKGTGKTVGNGRN